MTNSVSCLLPEIWNQIFKEIRHIPTLNKIKRTCKFFNQTLSILTQTCCQAENRLKGFKLKEPYKIKLRNKGCTFFEDNEKSSRSFHIVTGKLLSSYITSHGKKFSIQDCIIYPKQICVEVSSDSMSKGLCILNKNSQISQILEVNSQADYFLFDEYLITFNRTQADVYDSNNGLYIKSLYLEGPKCALIDDGFIYIGSNNNVSVYNCFNKDFSAHFDFGYYYHKPEYIDFMKLIETENSTKLVVKSDQNSIFILNAMNLKNENFCRNLGLSSTINNITYKEKKLVLTLSNGKSIQVKINPDDNSMVAPSFSMKNFIPSS